MQEPQAKTCRWGSTDQYIAYLEDEYGRFITEDKGKWAGARIWCGPFPTKKEAEKRAARLLKSWKDAREDGEVSVGSKSK